MSLVPDVIRQELAKRTVIDRTERRMESEAKLLNKTCEGSCPIHQEKHKLLMALICLRIVLILSGTLYQS